MRLLVVSCLLLVLIAAKPHKKRRSVEPYQSNENPYEVVQLDGQPAAKYHHRCGKLLREVAVLQPIEYDSEEFVLKRILIEDETGLPATGDCARELLEQIEQEDEDRNPIIFRKRTLGGVRPRGEIRRAPVRPVYLQNNVVTDQEDVLPQMPIRPEVNWGQQARPIKRCKYNRRPTDPVMPLPLRRCRNPTRRSQPAPPPAPLPSCVDSPWKSPYPCRPVDDLREARQRREEFISIPPQPIRPEFTPRRNCRNRPIPQRRDPFANPCNSLTADGRPCCPEVLTPHSTYADFLRIRAREDYLRTGVQQPSQYEPRIQVPERAPEPPVYAPRDVDVPYIHVVPPVREDEEVEIEQEDPPRHVDRVHESSLRDAAYLNGKIDSSLQERKRREPEEFSMGQTYTVLEAEDDAKYIN